METRRSARLPKYDYGKQGVYFVTLCTQDRACILWNDTDICYPVEANIVRLPADVPLSAIGHLVQAGINNIPLHYPNISVDIAAIMPMYICCYALARCSGAHCAPLRWRRKRRG